MVGTYIASYLFSTVENLFSIVGNVPYKQMKASPPKKAGKPKQKQKKSAVREYPLSASEACFAREGEC